MPTRLSTIADLHPIGAHGLCPWAFPAKRRTPIPGRKRSFRPDSLLPNSFRRRPRPHSGEPKVSVSTKPERTDTQMLKNLPLSKILLSLAAVSVIAVAAVGGTFANFTATPTAIASNAFASGTLSMTRSGSGAIFSASTMKIGDSVTGSVTITNSGTLAGVYSLAGSTTGSAPLASQLNLKVYRDVDGGTALYDGSLGAVTSASLGTSLAGEAHVFYFHVTFPTTGTDAGDNVLQGLAVSTTFTWSATAGVGECRRFIKTASKVTVGLISGSDRRLRRRLRRPDGRRLQAGGRLLGLHGAEDSGRGLALDRAIPGTRRGHRRRDHVLRPIRRRVASSPTASSTSFRRPAGSPIARRAMRIQARDPWTIRLAGQVGRVSFSVPVAGYILFYAHTREVRGALICLVALVLVFAMLRWIWRKEAIAPARRVAQCASSSSPPVSASLLPVDSRSSARLRSRARLPFPRTTSRRTHCRTTFRCHRAPTCSPGTATAVAGGNVDGLSIDFGTVPSARTFASVFRITNVSSATRTATLTLSSVPQVAVGDLRIQRRAAPATLAAGASTTLDWSRPRRPLQAEVGARSGLASLGRVGSTATTRSTSTRRLRRPAHRPGRRSLRAASTSPGAPRPRRRISPATTSTAPAVAPTPSSRRLRRSALTYSDVATVDGTAYTYKIHAVSSGVPVLDSLDSTDGECHGRCDGSRSGHLHHAGKRRRQRRGLRECRERLRASRSRSRSPPVR